MGYQRWRDRLGGAQKYGDFFNHVENGLLDHEDRVTSLAAGGGGGFTVLIYSGGDYPPRPAVQPGYVRYIGPTQPTTWLPGDEWVDNS